MLLNFNHKQNDISTQIISLPSTWHGIPCKLLTRTTPEINMDEKYDEEITEILSRGIT
jgi:hypothetical protein